MSVTLASVPSLARAVTSRCEWWIGALVLGGGVALLAFGGRLSPAGQAFLAGMLVVVLVVGLRRGWIKLFGPVLLFDLVRTARHSRSFFVRCAYAAALLAVLLLLYSEWFADSDGSFWASLLEVHRIPPGNMARFADEFFTRFLAVQFGMVLLLTPAYTAPALAEDKERKTLDFLLAADLRSREIVLGKLLSRLAHLGLFLLAGLPILGFLQLLGGVDPNLVLAAFAGTALTMLSLASVGILISAYAERPRTAIFVTYLVAGFFLACSFPMPALRAGNPFAAWHELMHGAGMGTLTTTAPKVLRGYAMVHGSIALFCCAWATIRLRVWGQLGSAQQPEIMVLRVVADDGSALVWQQLAPQLPERPVIEGNPVLWKEKYVESTLRVGLGGRAFLAFVMMLGCAMVGCLALVGLTFGPAGMNIWVRCVGTLVGCLLLLGVAVRAAAAFSLERERRTWDSLLTTPLATRELFWAKAWGSILCVRWGWPFLGAVWVLGMITLGLNPLMAPVLAAAWLAHAALIAGVGLWFSLVSRTTLRATVYTLLATALITVGPLLMGSLGGPLWLSFGFDQPPSQFEDFCDYGISPPLNQWTLAMYSGDFDGRFASAGFAQRLLAAVSGVAFVTAAAVLVWHLVWVRFARSIGRSSRRI